jgi:hypothetical protein
MPFSTSSTITALSTAGQGAVGVLAEILVARRVEQVESEPLSSKLMTAEETEMPRSRSIGIQSEHTRRRSLGSILLVQGEVDP